MNEKILYIVRGCPGSGKTTFAKQLTSNVFEADHFFYDENCVYKFDPSKIKDAHKECQESVEYAMQSSINKIAVSNTFTQEWEMKPYFELSEKYGYKLFTVVVENRHGGKNIHGVPDDKLEIMRNRFEFKL
jgi:predicted kinase